MTPTAADRRAFNGPDAWVQAFDYVREVKHPDVVSINGHMWKLYPNGRALCAATRPFHKPFVADDECDCTTREGETIAEFRMQI